MINSKKIKTIRLALAGVFFAVFLLAFSGFGVFAAYIMHAQLAPAILSWISGASLWTMAIVMLHMVTARYAGRVYCSIFCPLGIMQDIAGLIPAVKNRPRRSFIPLRCVVLGVVAGLLFCASAAGFFLLDPYSISGRAVSAFLLGGTVPVALILLLTLFRKRFFCTYLCPVGTTLGFISRGAVMQLKISDKCVNCGKCIKVCPAGCIEPEKHLLDNERCLRCMECTAACPAGAIGFERVRAEKSDADRREMLKRLGYGAAGFVSGFILARLGVFSRLFSGRKSSGIYPPGAAKFELFERKCTGCLLCTKVCPQRIIVPAENGTGPVELDLDGSFCRYDCNRCGNICPTGAIRKLTLPVKQRLRIAKTAFDPSVCIVFQEDARCGKCAKACPAGAVTLRKNGTPKFNAKLCIGCGACRSVCPTEAYSIEKISEQQPLEK